MKTGSFGLRCEAAKTLQFSHTNDGSGGRLLPPKFALKVTHPPLKGADFDQYLLIAAQP